MYRRILLVALLIGFFSLNAQAKDYTFGTGDEVQITLSNSQVEELKGDNSLYQIEDGSIDLESESGSKYVLETERVVNHADGATVTTESSFGVPPGYYSVEVSSRMGEIEQGKSIKLEDSVQISGYFSDGDYRSKCAVTSETKLSRGYGWKIYPEKVLYRPACHFYIKNPEIENGLVKLYNKNPDYRGIVGVEYSEVEEVNGDKYYKINVQNSAAYIGDTAKDRKVNSNRAIFDFRPGKYYTENSYSSEADLHTFCPSRDFCDPFREKITVKNLEYGESIDSSKFSIKFRVDDENLIDSDGGAPDTNKFGFADYYIGNQRILTQLNIGVLKEFNLGENDNFREGKLSINLLSPAPDPQIEVELGTIRIDGEKAVLQKDGVSSFPPKISGSGSGSYSLDKNVYLQARPMGEPRNNVFKCRYNCEDDIRAQAKIKAYTPDIHEKYRDYSCYYAKQRSSVRTLIENPSLNTFNSFNLNKQGESTVTVWEDSANAGSKARFVVQCFRDGKASNIAQISFDIPSTFGDDWGYTSNTPVFSHYDIDGTPIRESENFDEINANFLAYNKQYNWEGLEANQCSISKNILTPEDDPELTFKFTNKNDHPLKFRVTPDTEENNLNSDNGNIQLNGNNFFPSKTFTAEPGENSFTIDSNLPSLDFEEEIDSEPYGTVSLESVFGTATHEIIMDIEPAREQNDYNYEDETLKVEKREGRITCGLFTFGSSIEDQGLHPESYSIENEPEPETGESVDRTPDGSYVSLSAEKILEGQDQRFNVVITEEDAVSGTKLVVENSTETLEWKIPEGETSFSESLEIQGEDDREVRLVNLTAESSDENVVRNALDSLSKSYDWLMSHLTATGMAVARLDNGGSGGGTVEDEETQTADEEKSDETGEGKEDSEAADNSAPEGDVLYETSFEVTSYPVWKKYCQSQINSYSPDPERYDQVDCLEFIRGTCFSETAGENCEGVPESVCQIDDRHYLENQNACGPRDGPEEE